MGLLLQMSKSLLRQCWNVEVSLASSAALIIPNSTSTFSSAFLVSSFPIEAIAESAYKSIRVSVFSIFLIVQMWGTASESELTVRTIPALTICDGPTVSRKNRPMTGYRSEAMKIKKTMSVRHLKNAS